MGGDGSAGADAELRAHLATCAACRAEVEGLRALWADMGRLAVPAPRPAGAPWAMRRRRGWRTYTLAAAALAASFLLGVVVENRLAPQPTPLAAAAGGQQFLLLLHEPPGFHV